MADIERDIAALGRPVFDWSSPTRLRDSHSAIAEWEAAHPTEAETYRRLSDERSAADAEELAAYRSQRARPRLPSSVVPTDTDALKGVREWLAGDAQWCLVLGNIGTGKSIAARWAVDQVARTGRRAYFERAFDVARLSTWNDAGRLDALEKCHLLALDDVGTEGASDHSRTSIRALLDARHERGNRTIVTSNLVNGKLSRWLGERITDRIRASHCKVVVDGESMRGQPNTKETT